MLYHRMMDHRDYVIYHYFNHKWNKKNQSVYIRDIFVYPTNIKESFGEARDHNNAYVETYSEFTRLVDHVRWLANVANGYHKKYYCQINSNSHSAHSIKPDCLNNITRLLQPEFALYTSEPLNLATFSLLIENIRIIAKKQSDNVHLLLPFSVITNDNKILNMPLYVQCGRDPKIESFCKGMVSPFDVSYKDSVLFAQQQTFAPFHTSSYLAPAPLRLTNKKAKKAAPISSHSCFVIKTAGDAEFYEGVDICIEHKSGRSKTLTEKSTRAGIRNTAIYSDNVDQILISNKIKAINTSKITPYMVHIDPHHDRARPMLTDRVTRFDLKKTLDHKYDKISLSREKNNKISVCNPPFGSNLEIIATEERKLGGFSTEYHYLLISTDFLTTLLTKDPYYFYRLEKDDVPALIFLEVFNQYAAYGDKKGNGNWVLSLLNEKDTQTVHGLNLPFQNESAHCVSSSNLPAPLVEILKKCHLHFDNLKNRVDHANMEMKRNLVQPLLKEHTYEEMEKIYSIITIIKKMDTLYQDLSKNIRGCFIGFSAGSNNKLHIQIKKIVTDSKQHFQKIIDHSDSKNTSPIDFLNHTETVLANLMGQFNRLNGNKNLTILQELMTMIEDFDIKVKPFKLYSAIVNNDETFDLTNPSPSLTLR